MKSLSLTKPHVIVMVGVPGSGKSFFAEKFAETFHAPYICRDKVAEFVPDVATADRVAMMMLTEFLKTKQSVIIEGPSLTRAERTAIATLARKAGYETMLVWVQTHTDTARARTLKTSKPTIQSVRSAKDFDHEVKRFNPPTAQEKPVVISGMHTYATQVRTVLKRLSHDRSEQPAASRQPERTAAPVHRDHPPTPTPPPRRNITIN